MIDARTQLVGLIGWPVEHSLSPAMHNAAFEALNLNWRYVPLPVPPSQVGAAVQGLGAMGFRGANVTVPHKQAVMPFVDSLSANARGIGAINTLIIGQREDRSPTITGHNTDDTGFAGALRMHGFEPEDNQHVVIVGAGGAARAAVFGLLWSGRGHITILNRTLERARKLVAHLGDDRNHAARLRALPLTTETLIESSRDAGLLVNATTVGMWPHVNGSIWPTGVPVPSHLAVFDMVYKPLETRLLQQARRSGALCIDGLGMLVYQGALALIKWTNQGFVIDDIAPLMRAACEQALKRKNG